MIKEEEKKVGTILTVERNENGKLILDSNGLAVDEVPNLYYGITDMVYRVMNEACGYNHEEIMNGISNIVYKVAKEHTK